MDFKKKANRDDFLFQAVGIIFLIIIVILVVADFRMYQKKQELASQVAAYQKRIEDIKKSSQNLKDEIANSDNRDYLEKIAYEQLGQQKPGETEYIFTQPPEKPKTPPQSQNPWNIFTGWLSNSWSWLKNKF